MNGLSTDLTLINVVSTISKTGLCHMLKKKEDKLKISFELQACKDSEKMKEIPK